MDRLSAIRLKIERAKQHIRDLEVALIAYMESDPYGMAAERDQQTGAFQYVVADIKEIPPAFSLISSDVLFNLRSTLDHLAYQLVLASGNQPDRSTAFPIFNTAEEYETKSARKVKLM
ncbi:MAG TPA: hypothetical protein VG028_09360 [Terriglobia bacterium]|nr:hypothetical protein [Terriglobia bacterium]